MQIQVRPDEFDGRMIGLGGEVSFMPRWLFNSLRAMHKNFRRGAGVSLLERDKPTGYWRILPSVLCLRELFECPHFSPRRPIRAFNPELISGFSHESGRRGILDLLYCGTGRDPDAARNAEAMDHTPIPGRCYSQAAADVALADMRLGQRIRAREAGKAARKPNHGKT